MRRIMLVLGIVLAVPGVAAAEGTRSAEVELVPVEFTALGEVVLRVTLPGVEVSGGERIEAVHLELRVASDPGTEVQAWVSPDSATASWAREDGSRVDLQDLWVTDERTEDRVRLDVAAYLRRLVSEGTNAGVLFLRAVGPDMEPLELTTAECTEVTLCVRIALEEAPE